MCWSIDAAATEVFVQARCWKPVEQQIGSIFCLMVEEDADSARIWRPDYSTGDWSVVATVNDAGGDSSGIVDASNWFGAGSWLVTVQAHDFPPVRSEVDGDGVLRKLEAGQLLLMNVPGS